MLTDQAAEEHNVVSLWVWFTQAAQNPHFPFSKQREQLNDFYTMKQNGRATSVQELVVM